MCQEVRLKRSFVIMRSGLEVMLVTVEPMLQATGDIWKPSSRGRTAGIAEDGRLLGREQSSDGKASQTDNEEGQEEQTLKTFLKQNC